MTKFQAFSIFIKSFRRPLSYKPKNESRAEERVRILGDVIERCKLFDAAGLRMRTPNGKDTARGHLLPWLEGELADARLAVRFERGDL